MAKSADISSGKRGPAGEDATLSFRSPPELTALIDAWASEQGVASREEAIRRLIEKGLASEEPDRGSIPVEDLNASNDE